MNVDKEIFNVDEAAEFLRCSRRSIQQAVADKRITSSKSAGVRTFRRGDLIEFWLRAKVNARVSRIALPADSPLLEALWQAFRPRVAGELQALQEGAMAEHNGERAFV